MLYLQRINKGEERYKMLVETSEQYRSYRINKLVDSDHYSISNKYGEWLDTAHNITEAKEIIDAQLYKWEHKQA